MESVIGAGMAPCVISVCNGTGVATIVLLGSAAVELTSTNGSASTFGMRAGDEPVDVAMSGAGKEAVPWPG